MYEPSKEEIEAAAGQLRDLLRIAGLDGVLPAAQRVSEFARAALIAASQFHPPADREPAQATTGERIESLISFWSMRPPPRSQAGQAWEDGARQGWKWAKQELSTLSPDAGRVEEGSVKIWFVAHNAYHKASDAYNQRLQLVRAERERGNWTMKVDDEYRTLNDAQYAASKANEILYRAMLSVSPQPEGKS